MTIRRRLGKETEDPSAIKAIEYNAYAGAQKSLESGPYLDYVGTLDQVYRVQPGDIVYIFQATDVVTYITMGKDDTIMPDTAPAKNVFPVIGIGYTIYAVGENKYIVGSISQHLYILKDDNQARINP
jgi:hypothetical protein